MKFEPTIDVKDVVRKASLYKKISQDDIDEFRENVEEFFGFVKIGQEERTQAGFLKTFLVNTFYKDKYLIVEEEDKKDLSIKGAYDPNEKSYVFIETKKVDSTEMVKMDSLEAKAFYETVLYYMNERQKHNDELKHIIITNMNDWCVIDALEYDRLFWRDKYFRKKYIAFINGQLSYTDRGQFYEEIATFVKESRSCIHYIFFNLKEQALKKTEEAKKNVNAIYKLLSPSFMFKQYERNDNNHLNRGFYMELLHIMGLEEVDGDNGKIIRRKTERNEGSLIENAIEQIKTNPVTYLNIEGETEEERIFNAALQLSIIWINRLLFLKLLEAQLRSYNKGRDDIDFLTIDKLKNYNDIDTLFFRVLAVPEEERSLNIKKKYPNVPYLNSSLFEVSRLESYATRISRLDNDVELPLYTGSVLKEYVRRTKQKLSPLEYLLLFLDSYNFGEEEKKGENDKQKQLISASVLGLIFEKINGYNDGAIFTPAKITMMMRCKALRKAVVDKFNLSFEDFNCPDFEHLYNYIKPDGIDKANDVINSLRICDPAVGSGHFLVSALNELIAIKAELGILKDKDGKLLRDYQVEVQNDELVITDLNGIQMEYHRSVYYKDSQRVQEVIFNEKKTIIENCLFGTDINKNSVNICRLRLWIELLKSTYYDRENGKLQTLPNIDINIKPGNSLVSKFPIKVGEPINLNSQLAKKLKANINRYKQLVSDYKQNSNKDKREEINRQIEQIKRQFLSAEELRWDTDTEIIDYKDPYHNSTEWMLVFPEVLDDEARFLGFDVVIGNPPYINMQKLGEMSKFYKNLPGRSATRKTFQTYDASGDILTLFFELGRMLVREGGLVSFIVSNSWMRTRFGENTRKFLSENTNPIFIVDFTGFKVFENVTVETNIIFFERSSNQLSTMAANVNKEDYANLDSFLADNLIPCQFSTPDFWYILEPRDQTIRNHVLQVGKPLKDNIWGLEVNFGIKTGCNNAFVLNEEKYQRILSDCSTDKELENTKRLLRKVVRGEDVKRYGYEWAGLYLITTFPSIKHELGLYPAVRKHLETFAAEELRAKGYSWIADDENLLKEFCRKRLYQTGFDIKINGEPIMIGKDGKAIKARKHTSHNWFELQDSIAFWRDFSKPKLIWKRIGSDVRFAYDETGIFTLDSTCIAVGNRIKFLCGVFNSKMGRYLLKYTPRTGTGDSLVSVQAFHPIYIPLPTEEDEKEISDLVDIMIKSPSETTQEKINDIVFHLFKISDEETIRYIESVI